MSTPEIYEIYGQFHVYHRTSQLAVMWRFGEKNDYQKSPHLLIPAYKTRFWKKSE
jgi:hypothetical protein